MTALNTENSFSESQTNRSIKPLETSSVLPQEVSEYFGSESSTNNTSSESNLNNFESNGSYPTTEVNYSGYSHEFDSYLVPVDDL